MQTLCRGSGVRHHVLELGWRAQVGGFGRTLVPEAHANVLVALTQRKLYPRLLTAVRTQSRVSIPFPQQKRLLIILKVGTNKDADGSLQTFDGEAKL